MLSRRDVIKAGLFAAGAAGAAGTSMFPTRALAEATRAAAGPGKAPMRFVFIHKGNGLLPDTIVPPSFDEATLQKEKSKEAYSVDLDGHTLPDWMAPLADHYRVIRFDMDPEQGGKTRQEFVDDFANSDTLVIGTHFSHPTAGYVVQDDEGTRLKTED